MTGFNQIKSKNTEKFYIVALHILEMRNDTNLPDLKEWIKLVSEAEKALKSENISPTIGKYHSPKLNDNR